MDVKQIEAALEAHGDWWHLADDEGTVHVEGLGDVKTVVGYTREAGDGVYFVLEYEGRYFRKEGYHVSHDGTYWDGDFYEATPREKVVKLWEPLNH